MTSRAIYQYINSSVFEKELAGKDKDGRVVMKSGKLGVSELDLPKYMSQWRPYVFEVIQHLLQRQKTFEMMSASFLGDSKSEIETYLEGKHPDQPTPAHRWEQISNWMRVDAFPSLRTKSYKTIELALLLTRLSLSKLRQEIALDRIDADLVKLTALFLAIKLEQNFYPPIQRMAILYRPQQIVNTEIYMLRQLKWNPNIPTPGEFVRLILYAVDQDTNWAKIIERAQNYIELCLQDYALCCNFSSVIGVACILSALECKDVVDTSEIAPLSLPEKEIRRQFQREILEKLIESQLDLRINDVLICKKNLREMITVKQIIYSGHSPKLAVKQLQTHNELVQMLQQFGYFTQDELESFKISLSLETLQEIERKCEKTINTPITSMLRRQADHKSTCCSSQINKLGLHSPKLAKHTVGQLIELDQDVETGVIQKDRGLLQSYYQSNVIQEQRYEQNSRAHEKSGGNRTHSLACSQEMSDNSYAFHNQASSRGTNSFSDTISVAKECSLTSTLQRQIPQLPVDAFTTGSRYSCQTGGTHSNNIEDSAQAHFDEDEAHARRPPRALNTPFKQHQTRLTMKAQQMQNGYSIQPFQGEFGVTSHILVSGSMAPVPIPQPQSLSTTLSDECYLTTSGQRSDIFIHSAHFMPSVHPFSAEEGYCEDVYRSTNSNINQIKEEEERLQEECDFEEASGTFRLKANFANPTRNNLAQYTYTDNLPGQYCKLSRNELRRVETETKKRDEGYEEEYYSGSLQDTSSQQERPAESKHFQIKKRKYSDVENRSRGNQSLRAIQERRLPVAEYGNVEDILHRIRQSSPQRRINKQQRSKKQQSRKLFKQSERMDRKLR